MTLKTSRIRATTTALVAAISVAALTAGAAAPAAQAMPARTACDSIQADYSYYLQEYARAFRAAGGSTQQTMNYAALATAARGQGRDQGCSWAR